MAPTILEDADLPEPVSVDGIQQDPNEWVSMLYSFDDPVASERHETQYFEMFGNRGIDHKGGMAVTQQPTPWVQATTPALDDDVWEQQDTRKDCDNRGVQHFYGEGDSPIPAGEHQVRMQFSYGGDGRVKGVQLALACQ